MCFFLSSELTKGERDLMELVLAMEEDSSLLATDAEQELSAFLRLMLLGGFLSGGCLVGRFLS